MGTMRSITRLERTIRPATWMPFMAFALGCILTSFLFFSVRNVTNLSDPDIHHSLHKKPLHHNTTQALKELSDNVERNSESEHKEYDVTNKLKGSRLLLHQEDDKPVDYFVLVTGERSSACKTSQGSYVMMKTYKNKVDYCNLHGCKVWYALEVWQKGFTGTWVRYPLLLKLMKANPHVQWFMWMDSDAIFTDFNFSIPFATYNGWSKNLVVPGFWEKVYGENPDWMGLNAGVFLIRNSEWSHRFLGKWIALGAPENLEKSRRSLNSVLKNRPQEWNPDDQSALVYLLNKNREESELNIFLEAGYSLHGYFEYIVDKFDDILHGKAKWPFVTHFCGCNFCGGGNITERCMNGYEGAFNFADNQLLRLVGMRHSTLSSSTLEPISS